MCDETLKILVAPKQRLYPLTVRKVCDCERMGGTKIFCFQPIRSSRPDRLKSGVYFTIIFVGGDNLIREKN